MPDARVASPQDKTRQEAIEWFLLLRQESLANEDLNAFAEWLALDGSHVAAFADAEQLFLEMSAAARHGRPDAAHGLIPAIRAVTQPAPVRRAPRPRSRTWFGAGLAVAAAWLLGFHLILPEQWRLLDAYGSDYHTGIGEVREIPLSDGSLAILDTDSAIQVNLDGPIRQVRLRHGRLHVRVKSDPQHPFEVASERLVVRALGTAFDVRQSDESTEVTVQEHAVEVRLINDSTADAESATVHQGQHLSFQGGSHLSRPEPIPLDQAFAWQQGRLLVSDQPLGQLVSELERYRVGRIFLAGDGLRSLRVSGLFTVNPPGQAVDSLCLALGLKETRIGPWWVLLHR